MTESFTLTNLAACIGGVMALGSACVRGLLFEHAIERPSDASIDGSKADNVRNHDLEWSGKIGDSEG